MKAILKEKLKQYSLDLYGVSSKWEKMLRDDKYRIVLSQIKTDEPEYIFYQTEKGKRIIIRTETAKNNNLPLPDLSQGGVEYKWRHPTVDEMLYILYNARVHVAFNYLKDYDRVCFSVLYYLVYKAMFQDAYLCASDESEAQKARDLLDDENLKAAVVVQVGGTGLSALDFANQLKLSKLMTLEHQDQELEKYVDLAMLNKNTRIV